MDTNLLNVRVILAAALDKGARWPNSLGFDRRGWSHRLRDDGVWEAVYRRRPGLVGTGPTPDDARTDARHRARKRGPR